MAGQIIGKNTSAGVATSASATTQKLLYGTNQQVVLNSNQKLISVNVYWAGKSVNPAGLPAFEVGLYDVSGSNFTTAPKIFSQAFSLNNATLTTPQWITIVLNVDMSAHAGKTLCTAMSAPTVNNAFDVVIETVTGAVRKNGASQAQALAATNATGTVTNNQAWGCYFETADIGPTFSLDTINAATTPNSVTTNSTGNTAATTGMPTATGMTIGGRAVTAFAGSANAYTFSWPDWVDSTLYITGAQTAVITDGTNSPSRSVTVVDPSGWTTRPLTGTLNTTNTGVLFGFSPAAVAGDKILYRASQAGGKTITVDAQGNIVTDFAGTTTMWHIETATGIMRSYSVIVGVAISAIGTAGSIKMDDGVLNTTNSITTINLSALSSLKIETVGGPFYLATALAVPNSNGTFKAPLWVDGQLAPYPGSVKVTATDSAGRTASITATLVIPDSYLKEQFTTLVATNSQYLQFWMNSISKPLVTGDRIYWPVGNNLVFAQNSFTQATSAVTNVPIFIHRTTGYVEAYTVDLAAGGAITKLTVPGVPVVGGSFTLGNKAVLNGLFANTGLTAKTL